MTKDDFRDRLDEFLESVGQVIDKKRDQGFTQLFIKGLTYDCQKSSSFYHSIDHSNAK